MISNIITHVHLLQVAVLGQTAIKVLKEPVKVRLKIFLGDFDALMRRVAIDVGKQDRLREGWFDMFSGASVSVTTSSDLNGRVSTNTAPANGILGPHLVVKGAINSVLFGTAEMKDVSSKSQNNDENHLQDVR